MANPIRFSWEGTDNPSNPSGVATFRCNSSSVTAVMDNFTTASRLASMMHRAYYLGRWDAIDEVEAAIPQFLNEHRHD